MRVVAIVITVLAACGGGKERAPLSTETAPPEIEAPAPPPVDTGGFSIASYNINAGMSGNEETLEALEALDADIILLQEVTKKWWRALAKVHAKTHPHRFVHLERRNYGGLGVISRFPLSDGEVIVAKEGPFPAWRGLVKTPVGAVQILNVHLFPPVAWFRSRGVVRAYLDSQVRHLSELREHFGKLDPDVPTIVAGDFNENLGGDGMEWLVEQGFEAAHLDGLSTWRWEVRGREISFQLDHIMTRGFTASDAVVHKRGASDHLPISATLVLERGAVGADAR